MPGSRLHRAGGPGLCGCGARAATFKPCPQTGAAVHHPAGDDRERRTDSLLPIFDECLVRDLERCGGFRLLEEIEILEQVAIRPQLGERI